MNEMFYIPLFVLRIHNLVCIALTALLQWKLVFKSYIGLVTAHWTGQLLT